MISRAHTLMDDDHTLTDQATRERLADFLAGFVAFVRG